MQDEIIFSIVVPCYNRAHLIEKTIGSLLKQELDNFEIIVVDDGSTDDTEEVVRGIRSNRLLYYRKSNAERGAARNYGAKRANGKYINFFDSDDLALPNHLTEATEVIRKQSSPEWFHLGWAMVTPAGAVIKETNSYLGTTLQPYIVDGNPLSCNGVFLRTDIIRNIQFNEDRALSGSEDYELWYRLAARYPLHYSNTITSYVVDHDNRSVRTMKPRELVVRLNLLLSYLASDQHVQQVFGRKLFLTKSAIYSYLALHLSEHRGSKVDSARYLLKAAVSSRRMFVKRTYFATIRNILIVW